jgi:hypothetical protein
MPKCTPPAVWNEKKQKCIVPNRDPGFSKNLPKTKFKDPGFSKNIPKGVTKPPTKTKTTKEGYTLFSKGGKISGCSKRSHRGKIGKSTRHEGY